MEEKMKDQDGGNGERKFRIPEPALPEAAGVSGPMFPVNLRKRRRS